MVNAKFPAPRAYGFEIVHGPRGDRHKHENKARHQSKIYGKRNESHFRQIGGSPNTRDLSASDTTLDSRGARANGGWCRAALLEDGSTGSEMFFLLRMAFWLGLVLVLLPTDKAPDQDKTPQVAASDAIAAATAAVSDMSQFCTRQPTACTVGGQAATAIGARAQSGAKKVYQFITDKPEKHEKKAPDAAEKSDKKAPDHTGSIGSTAEASSDLSHQTLTPDDLQIEWQAPPSAIEAVQEP